MDNLKEFMIKLHRLDNQEFWLNPELIETVEVKGNTMVNLISGNKYIVKESAEDIAVKMVEYQSLVHKDLQLLNKNRV
ncbi:MAG: flagellar FlbD family protein [Elusimicrobiota bacterium]